MKNQFEIFEKSKAKVFNKYGLGGYINKEDANEYARLRLNSLYYKNFTYLGAILINGYYYPEFNVFD